LIFRIVPIPMYGCITDLQLIAKATTGDSLGVGTDGSRSL
jgi:hypothetical protein